MRKVRADEGTSGSTQRARNALKLLNELGFVWDPHEAAWQEGYEQLKLYLEENEHVMVPQRVCHER